MAVKVGSLLIDVAANVAKITGDMGRVATQVDRGMARVQRAARMAQSALGAIISVYAMNRIVQFGKAHIDAADQMAKMSRQAGVTASSFSQLAYAADLAGVSTQGLVTGFRRLALSIDDAAKRGGDLVDSQGRLITHIRDAQGELRGMDQVMLDIADRFAAMADGAQKTAEAQRLFGRSGSELIPMLSQGRDGMERLMQRAKDLGIAIEDDAARKAEEFNDTLNTLRQTVGALGRDFAIGLTPDIRNLAEVLLKAREGADGLLATLWNIPDAVTASPLPATDKLWLVEALVEAEEALKRFEDEWRAVWGDDRRRMPLQAIQEYTDSWRLHSEAVDRARDRLEAYRRAQVDAAAEAKRLDAERQEAARQAALELVHRFRADTLPQIDPLATGVMGVQMDALTRHVTGVWTSHLDENARLHQEHIDGLADNYSRLLWEYEATIAAIGRQTDAWARRGADSIAEFARTGKLAFRDLANSIMSDLIRMAAQQALMPFFGQVFSPLLGSPAFFNLGARQSALAQAPMPHASGAILSGPTMVAPGHVAGEAGPEAILPLVRRQGKLGVTGGATQVQVQVYDQRRAAESLPVTTQTEVQPDGSSLIRILIRDEVTRQIRSGELDPAMRDSFGISRRGARR